MLYGGHTCEREWTSDGAGGSEAETQTWQSLHVPGRSSRGTSVWGGALIWAGLPGKAARALAGATLGRASKAAPKALMATGVT